MTRLLANLVVVFTQFAVAASTQAPVVDGSIAPRNTWHTRAGCASRTGATETLPVDTDLEVAWRQTFEGELEGEPLVWGDWVIVCEKRKRQRVLHSLNLRTGAELRKSLSFKTEATLAPSVWGRNLVVRTAPNAVGVYRASLGKSLARAGAFTSKSRQDGPLSEPLLFEDEIYLRDGRAIVRLTTRAKEVWRTTSSMSTFEGELSLWGDSVWSTRLGDMDVGRVGILARLSRAGGFERSTALPEGMEGSGDRVAMDEVVGGDGFRFVRFGGKEWSVLRSDSTTAGESGMRVLSMPLRAQPAMRRDEILVFATAPKLGPIWALFRPREKQGEQFRILANKRIHPGLLETKAPISIASDVAYHSRIGVDLEDLRVVWRLPEATQHRVVPAEGKLLVRSDRELVCWRARGAGGESGVAAEFAAASTTPQRALLSDGTTWSGNLAIQAGSLTRAKKSVSLDEVLLVADATGRPLRWAPPGKLGAALRFLDADFRRDRVAGALTRASASRDPDLLRDVIDRARRTDVADKAVRKAESKLRALEKARTNSPIPKVVAEVADRLRGLNRAAVDHVWAHVAATPDTAPKATLHGLWRAMLQLAPDHEGVRAKIRAAVPDAMPAPDPFEPVAWLDFIEACEQVEFEVLTPDPKGSPAQAELAHQRDKWRKDLVGVLTKNLFVLTPPGQPGAVARCLSVGELACEALESMFPADRASAPPLRILLFDSRESYEKLSPAAQAGHDIGWTAGHYSSHEGISRMFVPSDDAGFRRVRGTFVHELTHHWLDERGPGLGAGRGVRLSGQSPGFWIVEGFASFVEEFVFDVRARSWATRNPKSAELDLLRHASSKQVLPWNVVLEGNQFLIQTGLAKKAAMKIAQSFQLGQVAMVSPMSLFYSQSAATCHYLYHNEDGKHRQALLDYVASYYRGEFDELDIKRRFGVDARSLGKAVEAYADSDAR